MNDQFRLCARHLSRKYVHLNNAKDPRMQNSLDFGMDLVRPFIKIRPRIRTTTEIQMIIRVVLGETNASTQSPQQAALLPAQSQTNQMTLQTM